MGCPNMPPEEGDSADRVALPQKGQPRRETITRSEGTTPSEKYLKKLCDRSFLSLWSYPSIFRDQGRTKGKGDGKEVADLLVVFENHVIVFSDKHIHFENTDDIEVGWGRWFRKAVLKSAQQTWGAERWIRQFPTRLFLDRQCAIPFPIVLPDPATAIFHRIVVAHDASRVCRERMGGSGSLMLESHIVGDEHLARPFVIGRIDPAKEYVHVFDDTSLDLVMEYLDTVSDFVSYLTKKEKLLTGGVRVFAAGEEELLAQYVGNLNQDGEHDFVLPPKVNTVVIGEGEWATFLRSDEHKAQVEANRISYSWDALIEQFLHHLMSGTQYESTHGAVGNRNNRSDGSLEKIGRAEECLRGRYTNCWKKRCPTIRLRDCFNPHGPETLTSYSSCCLDTPASKRKTIAVFARGYCASTAWS